MCPRPLSRARAAALVAGIAERLPKRTEHAIRNRWHRLQTAVSENGGDALGADAGVGPSGVTTMVDDLGFEVDTFAGFSSVV